MHSGKGNTPIIVLAMVIGVVLALTVLVMVYALATLSFTTMNGVNHDEAISSSYQSEKTSVESRREFPYPIKSDTSRPVAPTS